MKPYKDITGLKFGKLTPIYYKGNGRWMCVCDCGREKVARGYDLRSGTTYSCGCAYGRNPKFRGCDEDCFNCKYTDCYRPDYLCKEVKHDHH